MSYTHDFDDAMQKYAYIYRYDYKRNCIYKKLPGCEPIYYIYDMAGNCIFSQDGNQRQRGEWTYNIPDKFGRPCISGICYNNINYSLDPMQQDPLSMHVYVEYDGGYSSLGGYEVRNYSLDSQTLYSAAYYDNYSFIGNHGVPSSLASNYVAGCSIDPYIGQGLNTGTATAYFDENGVAGYTYSAIYYDSRYNVSQVVATNHLGRRDITSTSYSYTGKPTSIAINHNLQHAGENETYTYSYDDADRVSLVTHKIDTNNEVTLSNNSYNNLGQLSSVTNSLFTTSYTFDMHSWLKRISVFNQSTLFEENLKYTDSDHPCYNGNISSMTWRNANSSTQRYDFEYDDASRLISSLYTEGNNSNRYNTQYSYDCMGNVTSLRRNGLLDDGSYGLIDDLTLSYDGNQLTAVSDDGDDPTYNNAWNFMDGADSGIEYEYDENGNVTKDLNRNILSVQYNSLNLPSKIEFADGKTIKYTYSADGHKLRAVYTTSMPATSKQIDYCGNLIFENGQLQQINVEGGYVTYIGSFPAYHHYIKDHLGNNRMVIHPSALYLQPQINNYYPYGGLMANSTQHNQQRYKYNGKEFDRMHGLDWYDYGARWMDASIGRWHSMDPLCEKYYDVSPYAYCMSNPVMFVDPDGTDVFLFQTALPGGTGIPFATHSFIVVKNGQGKITYAAYGPKNNWPMGGDALVRCFYKNDINAYKTYIENGNYTDVVKSVTKIKIPNGMTSDEFDAKVESVIKSFGNDPNIKYSLYPDEDTEGNCNSSSSTILKKSGVPDNQILEIIKNNDGIFWGFSSKAKPWTKEEQQKAVRKKEENIKNSEQTKRNEALQNSL